MWNVKEKIKTCNKDMEKVRHLMLTCNKFIAFTFEILSSLHIWLEIPYRFVRKIPFDARQI